MEVHMNTITDRCMRWARLPLVALLLAAGSVALADPPGRVARLAYLGGDVSFAPAGEDSWFDAHLNRPLVAGDRLWTGRNGRIELQLGGAVLRLDRETSFEILNLDDVLAQVQVTEGTINLRVDHLYPDQVYEIDTPTLAFVVSEPGEYRLDVDARSLMTQVTLFSGSAEVFGERGRSRRLAARSSTRFFDSALRDFERVAMPLPDDFDRWAFARDDRHVNSPSRQYVPEELIGYADLDDHGTWRHVADYGYVWFPRRVAPGWAPFRDGHWCWIEPWGWTWVDNAPWGFAPFHYGRWVYVSSGWGWLPGPRHVRPVYAPALVAFVGGSNFSLTISSGPPIGWFPLGPRDVYVPWYRTSRDYFGRVNVHNTTIINTTYVTNIYNDYYVQGRPLHRDYTFRGASNAITVVPRDSFLSAQNAAEAMARSRLRPGQLQDAELLTRAPVAPTRASLVPGSARNMAPPARSLDRSVIARTAPAAPVAPFDVRQQAIVRNGGEPLAADQMRRLGSETAATRTRNIAVVGTPAGDRAAAAATAAPRGRTATTAQRGLPPAGSVPANPMVTETRPHVPAVTAPQPRVTAPAARERQPATAPASRPREETPVRGIAPTAPQPAPHSTIPVRGSGPATPGPAAREPSTIRQAPAAPSRSQTVAPAPRGITPATPTNRSTPAPAVRDTAPAQRSAPAPAVRSATPSAPARSAAPAMRESLPVQRSTPAPASRQAPPPPRNPESDSRERTRKER